MLSDDFRIARHSDVIRVGRNSVRAALIKLMDELELDAVIYPGSAARPAGLPTATVPMGSTRDRLLRPGLQFVGRPPDDQLIMNLAYSYERATNHRRPPP